MMGLSSGILCVSSKLQVCKPFPPSMQAPDAGWCDFLSASQSAHVT